MEGFNDKKRRYLTVRKYTELEETQDDDLTTVEGLVGTVDQLTPVTRTTGPVSASKTVEQNLDLLDTAIGVDAVPTTRVVGPLVAANTPNANLTALDAAIGTDAQLTPLDRTESSTTLTSSMSVQEKIDLLDLVVGDDSQIADIPINIFKSQSIYENINALDTYKTVRTIVKTIGCVGDTTSDYHFVTADDQAEQVIDLGAIIPAKARVLDCMTLTNEEFTGLVTLVAETGVASSGAELITSATVYAADAITASINADALNVIPNAAEQHVYVSATPGANWASNSAGKVTVYITIIDITNLLGESIPI